MHAQTLNGARLCRCASSSTLLVPFFSFPRGWWWLFPDKGPFHFAPVVIFFLLLTLVWLAGPRHSPLHSSPSVTFSLPAGNLFLLGCRHHELSCKTPTRAHSCRAARIDHQRLYSCDTRTHATVPGATRPGTLGRPSGPDCLLLRVLGLRSTVRVVLWY